MSIVGLVIIATSFYAGMKYGQSSGTATTSQTQINSVQGGAAGAGVRQGRMGASRNGGGFVSGQIVSKDSTSMVLSLRDGSGSKNIFFSTSTQVMKTVAGSLGDLAVGEEVSINGTANPDGSVVAQSIQLRPGVKAPVTAQ